MSYAAGTLTISAGHGITKPRSDEKRAAAIAAAQRDVDVARAEWEAAVAEAARKRAALPGGGTGQARRPAPPTDLEGVTKQLLSVAGTFSALAASRLGAGGAPARTASF